MANDAYEKIGQRVKAFRKERGFSQDELAEGICSRQTISLLENGQHFPSAEFMQKIAERLGVPFHEVMVDETSEFEVKVQMDIIKVYIETRDFANALELIGQLEQVEDVLEYQKRELVLCRAECLMQSGNAQGAIECLTELQQRLEQLREPDDIFMATLYDKLGTAYFYIANYSKSYSNYARAYQLSLRFPKFDITSARISYNLGMVCRMTNNTVEAIEFLAKAEQYFNNISDLRKLANATFELGLAYKNRNEFEKADQYLNEALVLYNSLNLFSLARQVKQTYAFRVLSKREPKKAIDELRKCAEEFKQNGDDSRASFTLANIAEILIDQKKASEAHEYILMALELFTESEAETNPRLSFVYYVYSKYLFEIENFDDCVKYSFESSDIFDRMGLERDAAESLKVAADVYRQQNMFEKVDEVSRRIIDLLSFSQDKLATRVEVF